MPERFLQRLQLVQQSNWIQRPVDCVDPTLTRGVDHATGQDTVE
jgi:hypothetical protein